MDLLEWARHSPFENFWAVFAGCLAITLASLYWAFRFFSRFRTIENIPTSRIRSAAQGYVELQGRGKCLEGPPIIAPLSKKNCTWYSFKVEMESARDDKKNWKTIDSGISSELFLIVDETGQCVIDPDGASVRTIHSDTWYGYQKRPQHGPGYKGGLDMGNYRYTERRLHSGDNLYAIGLFNSVGGAGGTFDTDTDVREIIREWKQDSEEMLQRFDKNRDGQLDMQEWQAVRNQALAQVMARHNEMKTAPPVNMLTRTGDSRWPYILSAVSQEKLVKHYKIYFVLLVALFFFAGAFTSWILNIRLNVI